MTRYRGCHVNHIESKSRPGYGANKGIGKAIVRGLAEADFVVYLGARDAARGAQLRLSWRKWAMFALCNSTLQTKRL